MRATSGPRPEGTAAAPDGAVPRVCPSRPPVDGRGLALGTLAALGAVFALQWAQHFFVPLLLAALVACSLNPLVVALERLRVFRALGAALVMLTVAGAIALGTYSLRDQIDRIIDQVPAASKMLSATMARVREGRFEDLQKMQAAAGLIENAANQASNLSPASGQPEPHAVLDQSAFRVGTFIWSGSLGALALAGQSVTVLVLAFFLLLSGGTFKRKLVRIAGRSLSQKRAAARMLDDINHSVQKYLLLLLATNLLVSVLTWIAFWMIGLDNAGAWAVAAGVLQTVPYLGAAVMATVSGAAAYMQFNSASNAALVVGTSIVIALLAGTFFATWMTGKIARLNPAAVFISLLFWSWLWGIAGMLLGIPIIVIAKVIAQHVEHFRPVAELLGN